MKLNEYLEIYQILLEMESVMQDKYKADEVFPLLMKAKEKGRKFKKEEVEKHLIAWGFNQGIIQNIINKLNELGMME